MAFLGDLAGRYASSWAGLCSGRLGLGAIFLAIIELGLDLSDIFIDMRLFMSYIRKYREITNDFRRFAGEFASWLDRSLGVEKETDPRGLSLGGDHEDLELQPM
jgi:hypothetical protein